jgi:hypothetical protein
MYSHKIIIITIIIFIDEMDQRQYATNSNADIVQQKFKGTQLAIS